jgi:rare lipoprotein A
VWLVAIALAFAACGPSKGKKDSSGKYPPGVQMGKASWYGGKFHGGPTASGETYNKRSMTAAHLKLKFGTRVKVTNLKNGRTVIVRINNRGPYSKGRIIDLSEAAAEQLDMIEAGVVPVRLEVLR